MNFGFDDDQLALRHTVREVLEAEATPQRLRATWDAGGFSRHLWGVLADVGVLGLTVPEPCGGLGMDERSTVLVMEEAGRVVLEGPLIETVAVGAPALAATTAPARDEWLAGVAEGKLVMTAVSGEPSLAATADVADLFLLPSGDGLAFATAAEVTLVAQPGTDGGRPLSTVALLEGTSLPVRLGKDERELAWDRGALGAAAQLLGVGARVMELATRHARVRHQFGQPIGAFQAVKHLLADSLVGLQFARPAVYKAAWSVATGAPTRGRDVSVAKVYATDAATAACRAALQVHGAIGYTWEHDLHLWLKRALSLSSAWGTVRWHRRRVADAVIGVRPGCS